MSILIFLGASGRHRQRSKLEGHHNRDRGHPHGPLRRGHLRCDTYTAGSGSEGKRFKVHNQSHP